MAKFRKKPVVIDAHRWDGDLKSMVTWASHVDLAARKARGESLRGHEMINLPIHAIVGRDHLEIDTLDGTMTVLPGDWVICGVKGEFYPCKPDIFSATYEAVTDGTAATPTPLSRATGRPPGTR